MGAHLARVEIEVLFRQLLDRVASFEVAGPVVRLNSITNGSLKHLPISLARHA
jgi:cholest-4-en-3-one 26-monooxygenase